MYNMFGAKPFGTPFAASASTFGSSTPFGTSAGFGTPGFGSNTPAPTGGLFGQNTNSSTATGLFGGGQQTTTFGGGQNTSFAFGSTPSASGGLFGQNNQSTGAGLFATPVSNTAFGAKTPGFSGFAATGNAASTGSALFGAQSSGTSLFGQPSGNIGFAPTATSGTTVKFNPPNGQDTIVKNGVTTNINTKHQCITAMKEYENKSIEELRLEDYAANRKGKQQQAGGSLFGTTPATQTTGFSFAAAGSGTGFGASVGFGTSTGTSLFGQQQSTGLFGQQNKTVFGTTTAANTGLGFGTNTSTGTSLFGQQQKPGGLFGANPVTTQSSLFGAGTGTSFGSTSTFQPTAFGTSQQQSTGLFGQKPLFGTSTAGSTGFSFSAGSSQGSSNLFAKPLPNNTFTGFNTASTATSGFGTSGGGLFNTSKPGTFGFNTTTSAPSFGFGAGLSTGTNMFGNAQSKPAFGNLGTTTGNTAFGSGFSAPNFNLGGITSTLGQTSGPTTTTSNTVQLQQTILALAHSPYGDSPLFRNIKQTNTKLEDVLKPTNPSAQKAVLVQTGQYKVSNRPTAKIKPKSIHGVLNGGKSQLFDGLEDDDFSFGNDTFVPRKSVKKLVIKKTGENDSSISSRASSIAEESSIPQTEPVAFQHSTFISRSTPDHVIQQNVEEERFDTENIIRSKEMPDPISDTPNKDMDDTIALLNARNKGTSQEPSMKQQDTSVLSHSNASESDAMDERPTTPPPPHPAGLVLRRPGYFTVPNLEELAELVDENGDCFVEDFTIARDGYGSIYFPGVTNVANLNLDDIVFFRRKEVVVYPDDDNKPPVGEGLNKKAEITLDCVWPRDKSVGTPIKDAEKLKAMKWQDKLEENSLKNGAKFVDYRPETGSWVFEVKHFSKYGLLDDSDDEDLSEQEKKKLRSTQQHQLTVQKQKIQVEELKQKEGQEKSGGHVPHRFIVGGDDDDDDDDDDMTPIRREVPMTDDDSEMPDITRERLPDHMLEMSDDLHDDSSMIVQPSSHRQATRMGVSARDMQVMKASFFDDEELPESAFGSQMFGQKKTGTQSPVTVQRDSGGPSLFSSALKSKFMSPVKLPSLPLSESQREGRGIYSPRMITPEPIRPLPPSFQPPVAEHLALASGLTTKDMPRKIVGSRIQRAIPMPEESFNYQKQHLLVDAGLFMGRSFRVGWGPNWTLANCGSPILGVSSDKKDEKHAGALSLFSSGHKRAPTINNVTQWKVSVEKLHVADYLREEDKMVLHNHEEMLLIQLDHSESNMENGCPVFAPAMGVEALHQYARQIKEDIAKTGSHPDAQTLRHMRDVWELCVALWGKLNEFMDMDVEEDSYLYHQARQEAVSNWLADTAVDVIKREIQTVKYEDQGYLKAILSSLTGRQIANACALAQKSGDHRLALLLAEPIGSHEPRQMLDQQIEEWQELNANPFFKLVRNKIYSLLAGKLVLQTREGPINTCEGLDWKRALALHLWYYCRANSTILEALEEYDRSFSGDEPYSQAPVPPYVDTNDDSLIDISQNAVFDTCYHLLKLYCRRSHQLEITLNPVTSTINQTDYRLSWHLSQVLQSLSYTHLSSFHQASLHMNFASQLEALDKWEWAVFVALHIEDRTSRESAVRCILNRYITLSKEDSYLSKENFLKEKLKIPVEWIHHAKALRAHYEGKPHDEAYHLLKAGLWNQSHIIIIEQIAPDAIISENYDYLLKFLVELSTPPSRCETIQDWRRGGLIFLDYINLCNAQGKIKQSSKTDAREMDRLQEELKNLCLRVSSIQCRNSRDRLCQSEMAKKAAVLLRSTGHAQPSTRLLASVISGLPMPEDYSLQELNALTRSFILEQTA